MPRSLLAASLLTLALPVATLGFTPSPASAESFKATLFEMGSSKKTVLFTQTHEETVEGGALKAIKRVFKDTSGKDVATEEVTLEGGKVKTFRVNMLQTGEQGKIEIAGRRVTFSFTSEGKTKSDYEDVTDDFAIAATLLPFLQARWDAVLKGQTIPVRMGVVDRLETVGFQVKQIATGELGGKPTVTIEMKPSSFIIAALVKPVRMTFERDSKRLVDYTGRILPRRMVNGKWETVDADGSYQY